MLKGLDNRLNADVLYALRAMGHGDTLVIADTNFPADSIARKTVLGRLLRMENLTCGQASEAVLSVFPLDTFVDDPISKFALLTEDFSRLGARLKQLGLPTVFILEGGYAAAELGVNAANVLDAFDEA